MQYLLVLLVAFLAACGGGSDSAASGGAFPLDVPVGNAASPLRTDGALRAPATLVRAVDATVFMDWAELAYPQYFPSHQANRTSAPYTYRFYPETNSYLGVDGDVVRLLGPAFGRDLVTVGRLTDFACRVFPEHCLPPVANAGPAQSVAVDALVTLDGSASSDPNSDPLTYFWTFASRPVFSVATLSSETTARPSFRADMAGTYGLVLTVNDGQFNSQATVTVRATAAVVAPTANAGGAQSSVVGSRVTLSGSGTQSGSGALVYWWTFASRPIGSGAALTGASTATPSFVPDVAGTYVASLVVSDGLINSQAATVTIAVTVPAMTATGGGTTGTGTGTSITGVTTSPTCCRVCSAGKPCGNSCISRTFTCHQGAGCAC